VIPPAIVWLVLRRLADDLRDIPERDPMTELLNRRGIDEALQLIFNLRNAPPACLLLMDVDHFKKTNDTYGHQAGDTVLCHVAEVLCNTVRQGDLAGRNLWLFAWTLTTLASCVWPSVCAPVVQEQAIKVADSDDVLRCTVTIGISRPFASTQALENATRGANTALYRGKAASRNRIKRPLATSHFQQV
jgi:diguanylate cyclase (GGDEF)-like protein